MSGGRKHQTRLKRSEGRGPSEVSPRSIPEIRCALRQLDARLAAAIKGFDTLHGGPVADRFRGLVIDPVQCASLLESAPLSSPFSVGIGQHEPLWPIQQHTVSERLASAFGLDQIEVDVLLIAVASEIDLRYERLFAYLQDDVARKRPTVDLILGLLSTDDDSRLAALGCFAANAPLLKEGLIHLVADPSTLHPPLLAQFVGPDESLVRGLLGAGGLHSALAACALREATPGRRLASLGLPPGVQDDLERIATACKSKAGRPLVWLHCPPGVVGPDLAPAIADSASRSLLILDASRIPPTESERFLRLAQLQAWFGLDLLFVEHVDSWLDERWMAPRLASLLREPLCPIVLGAERGIPSEFLGLALPVDIPLPDTEGRRRCWAEALAQRRSKALPEGEALALAARYRLTSSQINAAVGDALLRTRGSPCLKTLQAAARAQSGEALATVADKVDAKATWEDIVLPPDTFAQLHELCSRIENHDKIMNEWGFGRRLSRGRGTTALFSGGSGTGKTMAAEVIANALGLDLYRIDLARVVSKYIGETEKNLDRVFTAAERSNAILFFDEADALFGKRSEVKDAHDRYANMEVAYLLQKMEDYEGFTILASNLPDNLDEAFTRRLTVHIYFPFPDEEARMRLWNAAWPSETPVAPGVDRGLLAQELKLSGASIQSVAQGAAFAAAADGGTIREAHVAQALRRECEKSGRVSTLPSRFALPRSTVDPHI